MKRQRVQISDDPECSVELLHDPEDPAVWIVKKCVRRLFWRSCPHVRWFNTREQAERYAGDLVRACRQAGA